MCYSNTKKARHHSENKKEMGCFSGERREAERRKCEDIEISRGMGFEKVKRLNGFKTEPFNVMIKKEVTHD